MYGQLAKAKALEYGVGRTVATTGFGDSKVKFLSQKRECEAQACFHGGRALELALIVVHARATDRILGRDYSGAPDSVRKERHRGHGVTKIYDLIIEESNDKDIVGALEDAYQQALHAGINDVHLDDRLIWSFFHLEDCPFRETVSGGWYAGAETTQDNVDERRALFGPGRPAETDFSKMNCETFPEFLEKADAAYYEIEGRRRDMRWAGYSARDHQHGRLYVVIGTDFFARLVAQIIALSSNTQWTWHPDFRERWHRRHQANTADRINGLLNQNYSGRANLPDGEVPNEDGTACLACQFGESDNAGRCNPDPCNRAGVDDYVVALPFQRQPFETGSYLFCRNHTVGGVWERSPANNACRVDFDPVYSESCWRGGLANNGLHPCIGAHAPVLHEGRRGYDVPRQTHN